jgi:hypothetical protein
MLNNDPKEGPISVYIEGRLEHDPFRLIRTPEYMLTIDAVTLKTTHLFHMRTDPYQMTNLAGKATHAEVEFTLRKCLFEWAKQTGDESLLENIKDHEGVGGKY